MQALRSQVEQMEAKVASARCAHNSWNKILGYITDLATHGSQKDADMTWETFFKQALDEEESFVIPPQFGTSSLPFSSCLTEVTSLICEAQMCLERHNLVLRKEKLKLQHEEAKRARKEARNKKSAEKLAPCPKKKATELILVL